MQILKVTSYFKLFMFNFKHWLMSKVSTIWPYPVQDFTVTLLFEENKQQFLKTCFDSSSTYSVLIYTKYKVEVKVYKKMLIGQNKQQLTKQCIHYKESFKLLWQSWWLSTLLSLPCFDFWLATSSKCALFDKPVYRIGKVSSRIFLWCLRNGQI